jgi:hypothetical protein
MQQVRDDADPVFADSEDDIIMGGSSCEEHDEDSERDDYNDEEDAPLLEDLLMWRPPEMRHYPIPYQQRPPRKHRRMLLHGDGDEVGEGGEGKRDDWEPDPNIGYMWPDEGEEMSGSGMRKEGPPDKGEEMPGSGMGEEGPPDIGQQPDERGEEPWPVGGSRKQQGPDGGGGLRGARANAAGGALVRVVAQRLARVPELAESDGEDEFEED